MEYSHKLLQQAKSDLVDAQNDLEQLEKAASKYPTEEIISDMRKVRSRIKKHEKYIEACTNYLDDISSEQNK